MTRKWAIAAVAVAALFGASACTTTTSPSHVGLYYYIGAEEGNEFNHCTVPSNTDDYPMNDEIYYVPIDGRTWLVDDQDGADSKEPVLVNSKAAPGQQTGVQVKVWSQTSFLLNSFCGSNNKDKASPLVQWWERFGRGYGADVDPDLPAEEQRKDAGWKNMLLNVLVPPLKTAIQNSVKNYPLDALTSGAANNPMTIDNVERKGLKVEIGELMQIELRRLMGGDFFCGPKFNRSTPECPAVEVTVEAQIADPNLQAAINDKQAAVERAAAALAEAQGKVQAAQAQNELLKNAAWIELEKARLEYETAKVQAEACKASPNCTTILTGGNASVLVGTK